MYTHRVSSSVDDEEYPGKTNQEKQQSASNPTSEWGEQVASYDPCSGASLPLSRPTWEMAEFHGCRCESGSKVGIMWKRMRFESNAG